MRTSRSMRINPRSVPHCMVLPPGEFIILSLRFLHRFTICGIADWMGRCGSESNNGSYCKQTYQFWRSTHLDSLQICELG